MHPPLLAVIASFTMAVFVTLLASGVTGSVMLPEPLTGLLLYVFFTLAFVLTYFRFQGVAFLRLFRWHGVNRKLVIVFISGVRGAYWFGAYAPTPVDASNAEVSLVTSAILIVGVVFTGPVFEELFYRGILLDAIKRKTGIITASFLSSSLFAILHFPVNSVYGAVFLLYGLIFCALRVVCKSLLYPLILHVSVNLVLLVVA